MKNAVIEEREMDELEAEQAFENATGEAGSIEPGKEEEIEEENDDDPDLKEMDYVIKLSKDYNFNGKIINEIDLSRLEELTTVDAQEVDRAMVRRKHYPRNKYADTLYCKHVAMRATGLPADFFDMLRWKDMTEIVARVTIYFLFG